MGIGVSKESLLAFLKEYFVVCWHSVNDDTMRDIIGDNDLSLSTAPGVNYIPADFAGTITAPVHADLIAADVNNVLYDAGGSANALSVSDLIDTDLERIPVRYDDAAPHHIRMIGLFDPDVYGSLTEADKKKVSNYMRLWVYYWGVWYDAGVFDKENRTL